MKTFYLPGFDGYNIFVSLWDDVDAPKGVVQFMHGMSEYGGHYDEFARYLNSRGYIVFADDHRAHGRTESDKNRGDHKGDIFAKTLKDELLFREWLKSRYDLPIFLAGHSYGSFLAQAFAQAGTDVKAIALLGTGYMKGLPRLGTVLVAPVQLFARGWRPRFGGDKDKHFPDEQGSSLWLNSIPERRKQYLDDKYCHVAMSVNFDYSMMKHVGALYSKKALGRLNPMTAIGIFSGDRDKIGGYGEGVKKLHDMYRSVGVNSELHLYEGSRHEVVYDICGAQAQSDIADFFDKFIMFHQTSLEELLH